MRTNDVAFMATRNLIKEFTDDQLDTLVNMLFGELDRRYLAKRVALKAEEDAKRLGECAEAINSFLAGCAHAMDCRAAMRLVAGHCPIGVTAASGEMWNAYDGAKTQLAFQRGMWLDWKGVAGRTKPGAAKLVYNPLLSGGHSYVTAKAIGLMKSWR